jgi:hypothetical protein
MNYSTSESNLFREDALEAADLPVSIFFGSLSVIHSESGAANISIMARVKAIHSLSVIRDARKKTPSAAESFSLFIKLSLSEAFKLRSGTSGPETLEAPVN